MPKTGKTFYEKRQKKEKGSASSELQKTMSLTPEEQAIHNRVTTTTDKDWETIGEDSAIDYSLMLSPFRLPEPAQKEQDEKHYAFRWIARNPARLDEIRSKPVPFRWEVCNRITTPFLEKFIDQSIGCICREDQILVYKPWWMHQREQDWKRQLAEGKGRDISARNGEEKDGVEYIASKRKVGDKEYRHEVKGSDIIFGDAENSALGMGEENYGEMSDSDLVINE